MSTGLTLEKLLAAKRIMDAARIPESKSFDFIGTMPRFLRAFPEFTRDDAIASIRAGNLRIIRPQRLP